jgi:hypothetical protein
MWSGIAGRLTLHQCLRSGIREGARHFSQIPLDCAAAAGIPADGLKPDFILTAAEIGTARADMDARFPRLKLVGVHPGCAGNTCNLPSALFGRLAGLLLEEPGLAVIATGIPSERKLFEAWPASVLSHPRFYNACGQWSLRELAANVANFTTMVVPSTGPLHIAAAFSIPTVTAFCHFPSVAAAVWGNLTPGSLVLSPPAEFCERRRRGCDSLHCDFEGQVPVEELLRAVLRIVAQRTAPPAQC